MRVPWSRIRGVVKEEEPPRFVLRVLFEGEKGMGELVLGSRSEREIDVAMQTISERISESRATRRNHQVGDDSSSSLRSVGSRGLNTKTDSSKKNNGFLSSMYHNILGKVETIVSDVQKGVDIFMGRDDAQDFEDALEGPSMRLLKVYLADDKSEDSMKMLSSYSSLDDLELKHQRRPDGTCYPSCTICARVQNKELLAEHKYLLEDLWRREEKLSRG